jgi:nucleoside-diphosphate-sugar epimerase
MQPGVLVFGGSRGTGLAVCRWLAARGEAVTACVRPGSDATALAALGVRLVRGDVLDAASVAAAFAVGPVRAVINTVGGRRGEPRPDHLGTRILVAAAQAAGVRRCILVTAIGCGDSRAAVGPRVIEFLGPVLAEKTLGEDCLMASSLDWTILRPGGMNDDPASGTAILTGDRLAMGVIGRADLAQLVVDCLDDPGSIGRVYHAIDPAITRAAPLQRGEALPGGPVH